MGTPAGYCFSQTSIHASSTPRFLSRVYSTGSRRQQRCRPQVYAWSHRGYRACAPRSICRQRLRSRLDEISDWSVLGLCLACAGCVSGYGGCLFVAPVKHTLTGRVHFRSYPAPDGDRQCAVLVLDHTAYIYSPAQSFSVPAGRRIAARGISEFPQNVVENSHVSVQRHLFAAVSSDQHTRFLMNVITLFPVNTSSLAQPRSERK